MKVVIIANGQEFSNELFTKEVQSADYIIAADGGIYTCINNNITPHYVVGDIDSAEDIIERLPQETRVVQIKEQETTDLQKALVIAESLKPLEINIFCSFGKRTDHSLGNIFILDSYNKSPLIMHDAFGSLKKLNPGIHTFANKKGKIISLFCLSTIESIELKGFKYPLTSARIGPAFFGVSNEISEESALIKFSNGRLLVYELNE